MRNHHQAHSWLCKCRNHDSMVQVIDLIGPLYDLEIIIYRQDLQYSLQFHNRWWLRKRTAVVQKPKMQQRLLIGIFQIVRVFGTASIYSGLSDQWSGSSNHGAPTCRESCSSSITKTFIASQDPVILSTNTAKETGQQQRCVWST